MLKSAHQVEKEILVVGLAHPLPLHVEESRYDRVLQEVLVLLGLGHVPEALGFRQRQVFLVIDDVIGALSVFPGPVGNLG